MVKDLGPEEDWANAILIKTEPVKMKAGMKMIMKGGLEEE